MTELRRRIRKAGGHYVVVKNTLARRVTTGKPLEQLKEHFVGPTAVAYSLSDPVALAKVLTDFVKEAPVLEFKAGIVEGRPVAANQVTEIATMPGREELIAKLLFLMQSPISRFVRVLAAAGPRPPGDRARSSFEAEVLRTVQQAGSEDPARGRMRWPSLSRISSSRSTRCRCSS